MNTCLDQFQNQLLYWVLTIKLSFRTRTKSCYITEAEVIHYKGKAETDVSGTSAVTEMLSECQFLHPVSSTPLGHVRAVLTNSL